MSWDDIFDRTFEQANLIVSKHFERQSYYFKLGAQFLGASPDGNTNVDVRNPKNKAIPEGFRASGQVSKVEETPVKDNPFPEGFGRV